VTSIETEDLPRRAGKDVAKYVLPGEQVVLATRRHGAVLVEPTLRFLPVFAAGSWLFLLDPTNKVTSTVGLLVVLTALVVYALRVGEWWMRYFIVTRRRVLLTSGVIARTVTLLPLRRITDLTWQETLPGQLLGYGTFRFESAGQDQALRHLTFMPKAQEAYRTVSALLFDRDYGGAAGGDDEGNDEPAPSPSPRPRPSGPPRQDTEPIPGPPPAQP
jgi:PH (Pleckstrin Homology) domain-containing protein